MLIPSFQVPGLFEGDEYLFHLIPNFVSIFHVAILHACVFSLTVSMLPVVKVCVELVWRLVHWSPLPSRLRVHQQSGPRQI